jgi:nucleoside triphosphatase
MEAALCREIREETGLEIFDIAFLMFQEFIYDEHFWKQRHYIFFDYVCKTHSTEVTLNEEAQEYLWMKPAEALQQLPMDPYTRAAIQKYLEHV